MDGLNTQTNKELHPTTKVNERDIKLAYIHLNREATPLGDSMIVS